MSKEQLLHIFDDSTCLTRRQMRDYVNGGMANEESHAVEVHLNACPFCNDAIEGLFEQKEGNTADAVVMLDGDFLKDHLSLHNPQVHLNSLTASQAIPQQQPYRRRRKAKANTQPFWRNVSIAAVLLLTFGSLWYYKAGNSLNQNRMIAQRTTASQPVEPTEPQQKTTTQQVVSTTLVQETEMAPAGNTSVLENAAASAPPPSPVVVASTVPVEVAREKDDASTFTKEQKYIPSGESIAANKAAAADRHEPVATEDIVKAPTRNIQGVAATAPPTSKQESLAGASRRNDVKMLADTEAKSKRSEADNIDNGDELYARQNYAAALKAYSKEMNSGDKSRRQKATLMSAKCHISMGNKQKAAQLLQSIVGEGGSQKKTAKKLLKDIEDGE